MSRPSRLSRLSRLFVLVLLATLPACSKSEKKEAPIAAEKKAVVKKDLSPAEEAVKVFNGRCAVCHGQSGTGDGPGAAALKVKPRNYTSVEWQASVEDDYLKKIIVGGGASVGKDPGMAANPDLADKPEVLAEVVKKVRSFVDAAELEKARAAAKGGEAGAKADGEKAAEPEK